MTLTYEQTKKAEGIVKRNVALERQNREQAINAILEDPRFASSLQIGTGAGGSLAGTYPSPTLKQNVVDSFEIAPGAFLAVHFPFVGGVGRTLPEEVAVRRGNIVKGAVGLNEAVVPDFDTRYRRNIDRVVAPDIGDGVVIPRHINSALQGGPNADFSMRNQGGAGAAVSSAKSDHTHSLEFKTLTREIRTPVLELRREIREMKPVTQNERFLKHGLMVVMSLLFDDEDHTAEERERLLLEDSEFRQKFLENNKHEYDDTEMILRRKGKYYLEPAPDVAQVVAGEA